MHAEKYSGYKVYKVYGYSGYKELHLKLRNKVGPDRKLRENQH